MPVFYCRLKQATQICFCWSLILFSILSKHVRMHSDDTHLIFLFLSLREVEADRRIDVQADRQADRQVDAQGNR